MGPVSKTLKVHDGNNNITALTYDDVGVRGCFCGCASVRRARPLVRPRGPRRPGAVLYVVSVCTVYSTKLLLQHS